MAKRLSVKEILEAARRGGPAQKDDVGASGPPPEEPPAPAEVESAAAPEAEGAPEPAAPPAPASDVPTPAKVGRPLTLKEKLAAARAGGAVVPGAAPSQRAPAPAPEPAAVELAAAEAPAAAAPVVPAPAPALGRPLTLKEKLAAARSAGATAPSAPTAKPAAAQPAAPAPAAKAGPRPLPPLEKITDPKDLAEALRQTGAKKAKEAAAKAAEAAPGKAATAPKTAPKEVKPQTVLPKPKKPASEAAALAQAERRGFLIGSLFVSWVVIAWTAFTAGCVAFTAMMGRFMFPNVLAEPPSTIKIGLPSNFDPEDVNERFKAEWGFWVVRSTRVNGQDIIYALQSVCTHLGCPPNWLAGEQKFKCPCHGSGFYISGINFEGPAPRPLERFKLTVADDGQLIVDKSQKFQQELGQWSEPDSYVSA
jgi:cytochrome b6-f complex iron-sulfur subunit